MDTPSIHFTVTVKDSFEKFLAQIGGIVNLYLGFSGSSVCAFIIYEIDHIKKWYRSRKNPQIDPAAEPHTSASHLSQLSTIIELEASSIIHERQFGERQVQEIEQIVQNQFMAGGVVRREDIENEGSYFHQLIAQNIERYVEKKSSKIKRHKF